MSLADALIRAGDWAKAKDVLNQIPPTYETYDRYRLEAMVADADKDWSKADSFYETASGLTTEPSRTLNNWGFSKLSRGEYQDLANRIIAMIYGDDDAAHVLSDHLLLEE